MNLLISEALLKGVGMSLNTLTFSRPSRTSNSFTMFSRNLISFSAMLHFVCLNFRLYILSLQNIIAHLSISSSIVSDNIMTSSRYTNIRSERKPFKTSSTSHTKVTALHSPKSTHLNCHNLLVVLKAVLGFNSSSRDI